MKYRTLMLAGMKQYKGSFAAIFLLVFLAALSLGTVLILWINAGAYENSELVRAGFGDLTAWVGDVPEDMDLAEEIAGLPEAGRVDVQRLIFSNYEVMEQESDSEGQLIVYAPGEDRYRFFTDDLSAYQEGSPEIRSGEIYVSPSLISMMGVRIGDAICFPVARGGKDAVFTIRGYYEDPFMGSSMIGMKGFLICEDDYEEIVKVIKDSGIDALARDGAMLHISGTGGLSVSDLNNVVNENTSLAFYTEFVHSREAIAGFMLVLQNAFNGLLMAFAAVLFLVVLIILGHHISNMVEAEYQNIGILKTMGFTGGMLRKIWIAQYGGSLICGMLSGFLLAPPASRSISSRTLTTIGIKIPVKLPILSYLSAFMGLLILFTVFIYMRTGKVLQVRPMNAIRGEVRGNGGLRVKKSVGKKALGFQLALRQLASGRKRYTGAFLVAVLLSFFASVVGRMDGWLGQDGKGMMDAFNPADHDIGVQVFGDLSAEEVWQMILEYTAITDTYVLAMPEVAINGMSVTANVISEPERFHMLEGKACTEEDEIVVTEFIASDRHVGIGDMLTVSGDRGSGEYRIAGIYSCANDMGQNIGMSREGYLKIGQDHPHIWCFHYFLEEPEQKAVITEALETAYGGDVHVHENTWPGLLGIISAMRALVLFMYVMAAGFIFIVTVLTGSRILAAEQRDIGIYKAVGFTDLQQRISFALRFFSLALSGSVIGTILSAILADSFVSAAMKPAGISNFSSGITVESAVFPVLAVTLFFTGFAYAASGKIKRTDLTILIQE